MADYVLTTSLPQTVTTILSLATNVSPALDNSSQGSPEGDECENVQYIPGIVSNETRQGLENFARGYGKVHGYVAIAVCLFGVLSNIANIIVLTRKNMASSTNTLLLWLAVSDLLTMLSYLPFAIHFYVMVPQDPNRPPFSSDEFSWICFLLFHASFSIVCHSIAIWLTIALAIFRYIYICKPTRGSYYCSQQRARYVVILVIVLTIIICIPNYAVNTYMHHEVPANPDVGDSNTTTARAVTDSSLFSDNGTKVSGGGGGAALSFYFPILRQSTTVDKFIIQINFWVQAILIKLIPCGMLTTLTLLLLHAMHKAYRKRLKLKSQGRKAESDKHGEHNRTTGMLLAVVVLFTLTELPQGILTLGNIFFKCFTQLVYYPLGDLIDMMALTNNSVNFVLYCTMSTQFRTTFAAIFCPQRTGRPKWLKLRLVKSRPGGGSGGGSGGKNSSIEVNDKDGKHTRANNNGRARAASKPDQPVDESLTVCNELNNKGPVQIHDHSNNGSDGQPLAHSDKIPLTPDGSNGNTATHTHGYSAEHAHV
ncbi:sex peptide receptor [Aplysia californica]|uniref:Sex peptide receptor n=1 Tax=Aplysia californica TaxID=6500 RepID=A0ABM0JP84_APLCA|nr:sex peptide receptor [Aplysia californica]XP_012937947.1 sex peptide receptor [Aplysia californica]